MLFLRHSTDGHRDTPSIIRPIDLFVIANKFSSAFIDDYFFVLVFLSFQHGDIKEAGRVSSVWCFEDIDLNTKLAPPDSPFDVLFPARDCGA